ncbi:MAG: anaerobic ribonucleoside-triphosphate reductase activating protein [Clostridiales bacterium]|nr:anaerobic ribonucleoside-triphosphate reductase activating protein [Candidatus Crickella merdequi]
MILRMCGIEPESIVDGPGFRYVVFVQGCPHKCPGCHNPQSHSYEDGYDLGVQKLYDEIRSNPYLAGVTFSGGEPFTQVKPLLALAKMLKSDGLSLMSYSGYTLEELQARGDADTDELLGLLDILVDGRFIEEERNLTLLYRGSENQRVIDMNKTRAQGEVVLWKSEFEIDF